MFKSKLEKFIAKRAAVFLIFSAAADMAFLGSGRWLVFTGLFAGAIISFGRLLANEWVFRKMLNPSRANAAAGSAAVFTAGQLFLMLIIVLSYFISPWVLCGLVAGLLIIPAVVMINSVTEALGITDNHYMLGSD